MKIRQISLLALLLPPRLLRNLLFFSFRALFTVRSNSPLVRPPTPKATRLFIKTVEFSPHDTFKMKAFAALSFFVTLAAQVAALTVNTP